MAPDDRGSGTPAATIYLARHGQTLLNALGRVQGWCDSPLTAAGEETASRLGSGLRAAGIGFDAIYAADLLRHRETARLARRQFEARPKVVRDARLREISFGRFEGVPIAEMWAEAAAALGRPDAAAMLGDPAFRADFDVAEALEALARIGSVDQLAAEGPAQVAERAVAALTDIARRHPGENVLVISSGVTILAALRALGADLSGVDHGIHNGAVSTLHFEAAGWRVSRVNDTAYLAG